VRAIVTGAAGFIGSNLVDRLLADGHYVVGVDNVGIGRADNLTAASSTSISRANRFTLVNLDIQAPELSGIVAGTNPHVIFHLAAVGEGNSTADPQLDARTNILGTINLCEASRQAGVQRIVYAASGLSRYSAQSSQVDESDAVCPRTPHAVAKLAGEMYLHAYAEQYGLSPICLALANVYGPRQSRFGASGLIAILASALITGNPYRINRDTADAHDFVFVDDVVDAFVRAGEAPPRANGIYNIGTGRRTTAAEVYQLILAVLDGSPVVLRESADVDESRSLTLDSAKAARNLDWRPQVDLAEGLRQTVAWLCEVLDVAGPSLASA